MIIERNAGNMLVLSTDLTSNMKVVSVVSKLNFTEGKKHSQPSEQLSSTLYFGDFTGYSFGEYSGEVSSSISFSHYAHPRTHIESLVSYIHFNQVAALAQYYAIAHTIVFNQTATPQRGYGPAQTMSFTQTVGYDLTRTNAISHTIGFQSLAGVYKPSKLFSMHPEIVPPAMETW